MRPVSIVVLVVLAAASSALANPPTVILPQDAGSIRYVPDTGVFLKRPDAILSGCSGGRSPWGPPLELTRGFMEFSIPAFTQRVKKATLIITSQQNVFSFTTLPPYPPDVHEISMYPGDLIVQASDYDTPTIAMGTLETDINDGDRQIEIDVTEIVRRFRGRAVGFRIKMEIEPAGSCGDGFPGLFGDPRFVPPKLAIETATRPYRTRTLPQGQRP